jgi:ABC-type polysaccharide/polyol phosphate export permease
VLLPLSMMFVFTFVFTRALDLDAVASVKMPYALYAYVGLVPWTFFSNGLSASINSLVANRNLITKVYFPREVFPLSAIGGAFVDFCIAMMVLVGLIGYFHVRGELAFELHPSVLLLPMVLVIQVALMIGLGMLLAMANLFYRDVRPVFSVVIQLWMFVSAVVVPLPADDSRLTGWVGMNPMAPIIEAYRACIIDGKVPNTTSLGYSAVVAALALLVGSIWFRRASWRFAECI